MKFSLDSTQPPMSVQALISYLRAGLCWVAVLLFVACAPRTFAGGPVTSATEASLRAALNGGGLVTFSNDFAITISQAVVINQAATTIDAGGHNVSISA